MRKGARLLFVVGLIVAVLPGAFARGTKETAPDAEGPIRIGYTTPSFDISDVYEQYLIGMKQRLEELGIDYDLRVASPARETYHHEQLTIMEDFVQLGVDYLVVGPTDFTIAGTGLAHAKRAGIPTFVVNYADPHEDPDQQALQYAGYRHYDGARVAADWVGEYLNGRGKIALIYGIPGAVTEQRGYVFKEIIEKEHPGIEIVYTTYANFSREESYEAMVAILRAHPDVKLVHAISTSMAMGALAALREEGRIQQIPIVGWGGTIEEMDSIARGELKASVGRLPRDVGAATADAIFEVMNGRTPPLSFAGPLVMLDSLESIRQFIPPDYYKPPQDR